MNGSVTTFIPGGVPNTTVVIPASTPMILPTSPAKSYPHSGTKSRIKNTPRRGKPHSSSGSPSTLREPSLSTQASKNTLNVIPAITRPAPPSPSPSSVPVILNSEPCRVLVVSETPPASVSSILVSGSTSQSSEVSRSPRQAKILYADTPTTVVYTTANSSQIVVHTRASNPKISTEVKPQGLHPTTPFQPSKTKSTALKPTKSRSEGQKNKPVLPKVQNPNSMIIDLCETSTGTNFVIPGNDTLTFHSDHSVETPTSVGYTINITDILPPKPNQQLSPSNNPPKSKPCPKVNIVTSGAQTLPPMSTITQGAQLLPKDTITVKSQTKMIASQGSIKLSSPMSSQTSYIQFQSGGDSDDISVIPITILSGPGQQPITLDTQGIHNAQFISQVPQLVPFQTLAPSQGGSSGKLSKLPEGMENAMPVDVVIDVAQNDTSLKDTGSSMGELHHGFTRNVPEPYAADILSHLIPDGSLPAISSSQVSSVLSALDSPQQHADTQQVFQEQIEAHPSKETMKKVAPARKRPRRAQPKAVTKKKQSKEKAKEKERKDATNELVERVQCFKCRFCLFLTLDAAAVTKHIEEEHSSHLSKSSQNSNVIPCPGCSNVFVSEKSLSVHLSEDHKVALRELNDIMTSLTGSKGDTSVEEESPKKGKSNKEKAKRSPRTSAKIRVRNLMKDAALEKAEEVPVKKPKPATKAVEQSLNPEDVDEPGTVTEDKGAQAEDHPSRDDLEDHDYATVIHDDSDDGSDRENLKKRGKKRFKKPRKKRIQCSEKEKDRLMGVNYKCSVSCCAVRMRSHDNLVYHQRCHKKGGQTDAKIGTNEVESSAEKKTPPPKSRKSQYSCPECNLLLRSWVHMSGHLWRSHGIDMELHTCDQCDYKTPSLSNLVNLHKRTHGSERPFACDSCEKSFKTTKQLRNHKVIHANQIKAAAGEVSVCEICGRLFVDARLLRSHISAVHNKLKPFTCQTCGYAASSRSTLKMHMRLHTGEKPFHCDVCSYTTADHNSLRRHKKRHSGEKPYKCPHCFYACIQSSTYKVHLRTKHPGQGEGLMFSCQNCPFHTVSYDIYRTHVAQHGLRGGDEPTYKKSVSPDRKAPEVRIQARSDGNSSVAVATAAVATAAVSEPLPIILSFSTEDAHASEAPNMHSVVEEVSEAIIPGSDLHLLYSNFAGFNEPQSTEVTAGVVYGSQTSDFVMSVLGDSVIQVVDERNNGQPPPLVALGEERITGDLGELQDNTEDLKFKLCEEVRS